MLSLFSRSEDTVFTLDDAQKRATVNGKPAKYIDLMAAIEAGNIAVCMVGEKAGKVARLTAQGATVLVGLGPS